MSKCKYDGCDGEVIVYETQKAYRGNFIGFEFKGRRFQGTFPGMEGVTDGGDILLKLCLKCKKIQTSDVKPDKPYHQNAQSAEDVDAYLERFLDPGNDYAEIYELDRAFYSEK